MPTEAERRFFLWCTDMRLRGVHPDWIPIWCGANKDLQRMVEWLDGPDCVWPSDSHFKKPDTDNSGWYDKCYADGLPVWEALKEKMNAQDEGE